MAKGLEAAQGERSSDIVLIEVSVVLVSNQNDPSILNPDFLRYNEIVDNALRLKEPAVSTPVFSQLIYEGDILIRTEPQRIVIEQKGRPLNEDACVVPQIASRFVEVVSQTPYSAIGINAKSLMALDEYSSYNTADVLIDGGKWMSFKDVQPEIHLKGLYRYESRQITFEVGRVKVQEKDHSESDGVLFQANMHRDIRAENQGARLKFIATILGGWKDDITDFSNLVEKFQLTGGS